MRCAPSPDQSRAPPQSALATLADEGFRLFFPLAAIYAALFPLVWAVAFGFDLPLARTVPPALWHAHEMLVGAFGAALIGFLTTAAPEWTGTEPLRGRFLWGLAALWGAGRLVGVLGWDWMSAAGALADLGWMAVTLAYLLRLSFGRRSGRLFGFAFWLCLLIACTVATRLSFLADDIESATAYAHLIGFAFLGLLGLALARITVPVTNLILDPSETTSPFRPHPGRLHLAPGLVLVAMIGQAFGLSPAVQGYLVFAAGAAFMDRVAAAFVGRVVQRSGVLPLAGGAARAGTGLMMTGAALLGAPWSTTTGLHVAFMGGLGLGVYAVFCIAGLLHTDQPLRLPLAVRTGAAALAAAVVLRVGPDLGVPVPGPLHALAALTWAGAFFLWLAAYGPALRRPRAAAQASPSEPTPTPLASAPFTSTGRLADPPGKPPQIAIAALNSQPTNHPARTHAIPKEHAMRHILALAISTIVTAGTALAGTEEEGLSRVKAFTLEHNAALIAEAQKMRAATADYAAIVAAHGGDYAAAWAAEGPKLAEAVRGIRAYWLTASNEYETIEGIVAGIPATAKYDLILDAGNPGTEEEDVAEYDLTLPDGTVLHHPGSLFHTITEPLFWGTDPGHVKLTADLDGNGQTGAGEVLFDANLALGAADAMIYWSKALEADMNAWKPNRDDAFTAVVTMTPTVGDYFGEWKESQFLGGAGASFVAQSRLVDVAGIMSGCQRMYVSAISPVVASDDAALDASISSGFEELLALVTETRAREAAGDRFTAEEADALGGEAQDIADRIVAQVLQAAAKHGVEIKG